MAERLDAIFFDIDDTLYSTSDFAERARRASVEAMVKAGLKLDANLLQQELSEVVAEFTSNYDHHFDQLLRRIPKRHYKGVNPAIIIAAGVVAYHDTKVRELAPYVDAVKLLRQLARTDLIRGIITSGLMIKQAEKIIRLGIYELLTPTAIFISDQIGINKPNVKLYRRVCEQTGLEPAETLYVGDDPVNDIDPANAIGMHTCLFTRVEREREAGTSKPSHVVSDYGTLREILKKDYRIEV